MELPETEDLIPMVSIEIKLRQQSTRSWAVQRGSEDFWSWKVHEFEV